MSNSGYASLAQCKAATRDADFTKVGDILAKIKSKIAKLKK